MGSAAAVADAEPGQRERWVDLMERPLPINEAMQWVRRPASGAVALFCGTVRDHSPSHPGVTALEYEAYENPARRMLADIAQTAQSSWPELGPVAILHRLGVLPVGEDAVVIAVSAAHRDTAFDAARWCIDEVKRRVPIWKCEHWAGGHAWVACHGVAGVPG